MTVAFTSYEAAEADANRRDQEREDAERAALQTPEGALAVLRGYQQATFAFPTFFDLPQNENIINVLEVAQAKMYVGRDSSRTIVAQVECADNSVRWVSFCEESYAGNSDEPGGSGAGIEWFETREEALDSIL